MIEIASVSKFYNQKRALDGVDLTIQSGRIFGLIGPNGAGKTTLIRILNQIIEPSAGHVRIGGIPLNNGHVKTFGYLPEERGLYREMKVLDHLVFLARIRGLSKSDALKASNFWLDKFEINPWSAKRIDSLSKGMAQKVQFIGTVLHDPNVIILDEPLSGFDPLNIQLILQEIKAMKKAGKTVIFSTHNMNSVDEICDEVGLVNQGRLVAHDHVSALREKHKTGAFKVRYKGNQIAFANALWTGFELIYTEELGEHWFQSVIKSRHGEAFSDVYQTLSSAVELQLLEEQLPGMQDIFLELVTNHSHE
jgi:ABC-2 type transport system ATP-binding protein